MPLKEVGFWRRFERESNVPSLSCDSGLLIEEDSNVKYMDLRPWPEPGSSIIDPKDLSKVVDYLNRGFLESFEFGYATCRLCGLSGINMGACSLTDGVFVWPEGLPHYLLEHSVCLPSEFISHVLAHFEFQQKAHNFDRRAESKLLEWDPTSGKPKAVQRETLIWILENTYIGLYHHEKACCICPCIF